MLGDSSVLGSSFSRGDNTAAVAAPESGGGGGDGGGGGSINSGEDSFRGGGEELLGGAERLSFGGNRWPRQETIALLQIRSDMDVAFRDASVKGPLWDEVSRKLAAHGYHRSAKKCKEKFENVYKYHRRTKEGRTGKSEGKTYRFFDQLSAFENQPPTPGSTGTNTTISTPHQQQARPHPSTMAAAAATMAAMSNSTTIPLPTNPLVLPPPQPPPQQQPPMTNPTDNPNHLPHHNTFPSSFPTISTDLLSNSTSSSTSSDQELEGRAKRKRKWKDFFERLMKEVVQKQDDLQRRFLEAIEKREHERMAREEAWRMQEMARINREREILAQERSIAAAKDAAVMSFLQKVSEQQQNQNQNTQPGQAQANNNNNLILPLPPPPPPLPPPPRQPAAPPPPQSVEIIPKANNNGEMTTPTMSSSRWPKVEVEALIELRTNLDAKYQENGPKGPLWEEISGQMKKLGYNRNAKRCKEKWENINKYFKKVKESNKTRPEDSKTCPYFHLLDNLYRERNKFDRPNNNGSGGTDPSGVNQFRPENAVPLMVRPEQQWPPQQQQEGDHHDKENAGEEDDQDEEEDEEEDDDGNFEVVANKPAPVGALAAE